MQRFLFIYFCIILFWAPIPLGSHRIWSASLLELLIGLLFIFWLFTLNQNTLPKALINNKKMIALFAAIPLWSALQLIPLPPEIITLLSPHHQNYIAANQWQSLSLDTGATLYKLQKSIAYCLFFILSLAIINTPRRLNTIAQLIVITGVLQAVYGVLVVLGGPVFDVFGIAAAADRDRITSASGTFVNRNNFAGYLEMCIALGIGLLVNQILINKDKFAGVRAAIRNFLITMLSGKARLRVFLALMVVALVLSHSRGGNSAFYASLGICAVIGLWLYRKHHKSKSLALLFGSLIAIDVLILSSWFGLDTLAKRLDSTNIAYEERSFVFENALLAIKDFWLTGSGVGGFYSIFPSYRDNRSQSFYDFAHNDYLQLWIEYGLIGLSLFGLIVILSFIKALKAQQHRHTAILKGMGFAAMMAIISLMIHATTEFNFHIPANALLFTLICAIACISADMENQEHEPKRRRKHSVPSTKA